MTLSLTNRKRFTMISLLLGLGAGACGTGGPDYGNSSSFGRAPSSSSGSSGDEDGRARSASGIPAISGGTLLVTRDHTLAFASDPDRDRVVIVSLEDEDIVAEVAVEEGSEPGRSVEDGAGRVHVALRRGGTVLTLDRAGKVLATRSACPAPRGIDYEPQSDQLLVACAGGELVRMGAAPDAGIASTVDLGADLRDVIVSEGHVFVSRFRSAEILVLDEHDHIKKSVRPPTTDGSMEATVAWRMTPWPGRGVYVSHQRSTSAEIDIDHEAAAYLGGGHGVVEIAGSTVDTHGHVVETGSTEGGALPVDAAVNEQGTMVVTVSASADLVFRRPTADGEIQDTWSIPGEPIAIRYAGDDVVVQTREPSSLVVIADGKQRTIDMRGEPMFDVGHAAFHRTADGAAPSLTCASCHPEGRDDGHTWSFTSLGKRRTQSLLGGIKGLSSFHWDGALKTFGDVVDEVYVERMGNRKLTSSETNAFETWIDGLEDLPAIGDAPPQGRAAFQKAGCDTCHNGERFSNDSVANVGTGGTFKVPSLVGVRYRAPFLHDGCAPTIADRFGDCGGQSHGDVTALSDEELDSLIGYLGRL